MEECLGARVTERRKWKEEESGSMEMRSLKQEEEIRKKREKEIE